MFFFFFNFYISAQFLQYKFRISDNVFLYFVKVRNELITQNEFEMTNAQILLKKIIYIFEFVKVLVMNASNLNGASPNRVKEK